MWSGSVASRVVDRGARKDGARRNGGALGVPAPVSQSREGAGDCLGGPLSCVCEPGAAGRPFRFLHDHQKLVKVTNSHWMRGAAQYQRAAAANGLLVRGRAGYAVFWSFFGGAGAGLNPRGSGGSPRRVQSADPETQGCGVEGRYP